MHIRFLALGLLLTAATPALADVTILTDKGTTIEKARDCSRAEGSAQCQIDTIFTTAEGDVATKTRLRTTIAGSSASEITLTGPEGNTRTRKRLVSWGN